MLNFTWGDLMTALITGASGGLGEEFARLLAKDKYDLILVARRKEKLLSLKDELEKSFAVKVFVYDKDLSAPNATREVFDFVKTQNLFVELLVNNAGFGDWGFFSDCNIEKQIEMINLNILALTTLTRLFLPEMIKNNVGKILNVASIASFMPGAKMSVYYATKAFVRSFSEALSVELKKTKSSVTVTALCPGPVSTDFWNRAEAGFSKIFSRMIFAGSKNVALYGYKKMKKGKLLALSGFSVRVVAFLTKILPRSFIRNAVYWVQK